jgi:NAD(P)-dependent dehydrogenase (short-subunit alcohol dehydrogenase family)
MAQGEKTVLITGAAGGVGSALVERLEELGWSVFAGVRSAEAGLGLAERGRAVTPIVFDLRDDESILDARNEIAYTLRERGLAGLNALVNNAGLVVTAPVELVTREALRRQFEVNVFGTVAVTQAFLPLVRAGKGRVINVSGAAASVALPMLGPIAASKAALESLSDALRMELRHQGVDVSIITPGLMQTDLHPKALSAGEQDGYAGTPASRRLYSEAIAASNQALLKANEAPVSIAVEAVIKALTAARPATRYVVGRDARQLRTLRYLPDRLRDRLLIWNRGLRPGLFDLSAVEAEMSLVLGEPPAAARH